MSPIVRPLVLLAAITLTGALASPSAAAPGDDDRTTLQRATEAIAAQRNEAAARFLQTYIASAVGDPDIPKAQQQLHDSTAALAKEWAAQGREAEAASLFLWLAKDSLTPDNMRDYFTKQAFQTLASGVADARDKHFPARALALNKAALKLFPDKPPLLTPAEIDALAIEGLLAACKDKYNLLALPDCVRDYYPDHDPPWDDLAKRNHESLQRGYLVALAEVGWAGRFLAEYQRLPEDSPLRSDRPLTVWVEKMHLARAQNWASEGNGAAAQQALDAAKGQVTSDMNLATLKALQATLAKSLAGDPHDLTFPADVTGKITWLDPGAGFKDAKDVTLDADADITVKGGFLLDGGSIEIQRGHLRLKGTPAQPVIFRNVTLQAEVGSRIDADNAVFINCTFARTKPPHPFSQTHWTFSGCLLYHSNFERFSSNEYAVHIDNCAWLECTIPQRKIVAADLAAAYQGRNTHIANCLFYRSKLAPSVVWSTRDCNFVRCTIAQQNEFDSATSLPITLFAPALDPFGPTLRAATLICNKGEPRYALSPKPLPVTIAPQLWSFLPVEGPEPAKAPATDGG